MNRSNGGIRIPVKLETKMLERQMDALFERFTELDEQAEKALEVDDVDTYNRLVEQANELRREHGEIRDLKNEQIAQLQKQTQELEKQEVLQGTNASKIDGMTAQLDEMVQNYKLMQKSNVISEQDIDDAKKLKEEILQLVKEIEKLSGQRVKVPGITDGDNNENTNGAKNLERNFKNLTKSAKKLVLGVLGVRGAYMLFRKATSYAMQDDKQITKDMEANWTALGVIMKGVIEMLVNGFRKLVTGILYFMQCLTGTNYIAKANEAILKKQTKATNDLAKANKKLTTSFDELQVMQDNSNASEDDGSTYRLLDLNELGTGAIRTIEKVAEALRPVYDMVKDIVGWALEHPGAIIGILGGATLLSHLGKVLGVAGVGGVGGTALAGIYGTLLAIASIGVIVISIKTIWDASSKYKQESKARKQFANDLTESTKEQTQAIRENIEAGELSEETIAKINNVTKAQIDNEYNLIKGMQAETRSASATSQVVNAFNGHLNDMHEETTIATERMWDNVQMLKEEGDKYGWTQERQDAYRSSLEKVVDVTDNNSKALDWMGISMEDAGKKAKELGIDIENPTSALDKNIYWNIKARDELDKLDKKVDTTSNFFANLRNKIAEVNGSKANIEIGVITAGSIGRKLIEASGIVGSSMLEILGRKMQSIGLATGGIVNLPGRGVPLGNVVTGEVSQEGVIPLTDAQAMETLGEAIGRHVNIQATLINQINGRTLSREVRKIANDEDFAYNG